MTYSLKRFIFVSALFLLVLLVLGIRTKFLPPVPPVLFVNETPSVETGLYIRNYGKIKKENYVVVNNDYIKENFGIKLLKIVKCTEGEPYIVKKNHIVIGEKKYEINHQLAEKYNLPKLEKGTYTVAKNNYLVFGKAENSLDSRYLGEIPKQELTKVFPLLVFDIQGG